MLDFTFGRTFWSTVIRSALFFPLLTFMMIPLVLLFGSAENIVEIRSYSGTFWIVTIVWGALFGSWVGWGLAYWRFKERPVQSGDFAKYPLISGFFNGAVMWILIDEYSKLYPVGAGEKTAAIIFGLIVGPFMALLISAFWRYAPQLTAMLKNRRSESQAELAHHQIRNAI